VDTLSAQVQRLMTSVADLSADQRLTDRRLGALEDSATAANDDGAP
jgi:outer membrane murein-binding lipoprotein Lpp